MPYQQFRNLMAELNDCTFKDAGDLIAPFRMKKSLRELDQIRRASRILGRLMLLLKESNFERANERAVEAALYRAARFEGAEDLRILIAKPDHAKGVFRPTDSRPLEEDRKVAIYLAVEFERYWAEAIRTFVFRGTSFAEEDAGQAAGFSRLCEAVKPGAKISDFCQGASTLLGDKGMEVLRPYGRGNGIGLGLSEAPLLTEENPGELREGMVLSLRAAFPRSDGSYSMVGNTVLVDGNGGVVLTAEPLRPEE
jgi:Xaa-Pro aminopeptidase